MIKKIRKRDGSVVLFQKEKIADAIWKAVKAVGGQDRNRTEQIADLVVEMLEKKQGDFGIPEVEEVQDVVEKVLIEEGHAQVAKAYILYRKSHDELRNVKGLFDTIEVIDDYVGLNDWMVKENSNMGFSLQGLNNYIATKIITNYWMRRIYPEAIRNAHENVDLHIHDLGCLAAYCFDDKTKILTENGWKFFKDVKAGEKVATKNLKTGELEFQIPYGKQVYDYSGELYSFEGRNVSLFVTPEHRLLVRRKHKKTWEFVNPPEFKYGMEFDKRVSWGGKNISSFRIPYIKGGNRKREIGNFKIKDYLEFMGWYISEGSVYEPKKGDYRISIAQSEKRYRQEIIELLDKMKLKYNNQSEFNIHLHSKDLFYHLKRIGTSKVKYIPKYIKELDSKLIKIFLMTLFKGDGSFTKEGKFKSYSTRSEKLAEDVAECLLKIGLCGSITKRKDNGMYVVNVENNHLIPIYKKKLKKEEYIGMVYDFSVKNGTLIVLRNGKIVISGNCVGWDLKDLLMTGFKGVAGKVESKPAKHFRAALGQIVNFFYTLQGECYSDDTYLLTDNGWKLFKNIDKKKDKVYTLNPKNKKIELQKPTKFFEFENKEMINFCNNKIDLLVTPNHNMLVAKYNPYKKRSDYKLALIKADEYNPNIHLIPKGGKWIRRRTKFFKLPSIILKKYQNYGNKWIKEKISEIKIPMDDWLAFFGIWLSEGSCSKILKKPKKRKEYYEYYTRISQDNKKNHKKIEEILSKLPFNWSKKVIKNKTDFVIYSKGLYTYLSQFGKSKDKFIPKEIKNLKREQLKILFDLMMLGDGYISNNGNYEYYTNSQKLANDVQEIVLKLGFNANIRKKSNKLGSWYVVAISRTQYFKLNKSSIKTVGYSKKVYCVEVPNHTLYVRRNGKACWCGNSAGAQAFSNFDTLLAPFIRYDKLDYNEVKQAMQEFLFNLAVPTRVGFQCMSEDTEILTPDGWKGYDKLNEGDIIKTFNIHSGSIEDKPIRHLFFRRYNGVMYNLKNRIQDQLISPGHRIVFKLIKSDKYLSAPIEKISNKSFFVPASLINKIDSLADFKDSLISNIEKVNYEGIIWCPNTDNETVVAKRNGKVFITGNTPFTNITMDLKVPEYMKNESVIIGGQAQKETYSKFQEEMDILNKAFAECMIEGDASGRVFTFPIPTYNITKDFDWGNKNYDLIWDMTAKYGIPYFSNFINSDMKPEDARSMCLHGDEEIIVKMNNKIQRTTMKDLVETYGGEDWSECKEKIEAVAFDENYHVKWERIKNFLKVQKQGMRTIKTRDGKFSRYSLNHPILVLQKEGFGIKFAKDIQAGDYMLSLKSAENILSKEKQNIGDYELNEDMAFLLGFFTADGNYLYKSGKTKLRGLQFTFNSKNTKLIEKMKILIKSTFNYEAKEKKDLRYNTYYLYIYNSNLAEMLYNIGFKKYGRLSNIVFNSSKKVIESFLEGFFCGDGYEKRKEIHINDNLLIRDLTILYSLLGIPNILKIRKKSQILYLQHKHCARNKINQTVSCINELVPGFLAKSTFLVPGLIKSRMVGQSTLQKYCAETETSKMILSSNIYPIRVTEIIDNDNIENFYDIELEKNHKFVHSLGTITNNCCRLRLNKAELRKRGGGLFGSNPLTGSLGVVTINMPRLGFTSANENDFFDKLDNLMELAKESLEIKRKAIERFTEIGLYPYSKFYLRSIKERFGEYWKNHFSTIGLLGMNEAIVNFMPGENIATEKGRRFAIRTLEFMRIKLEEFQKETENIYNLEATPGEGTTYRFARTDKNKFGKIISANENAVKNGGKPYYTNSTQLPVNYTDDLFEALELQDELQVRYSGGTVFHCFIGEKLEGEGVKMLVKKMAESFRMPYFTLTPTFSVCPIHGYLSGDWEYCPKCDGERGYNEIKIHENLNEVKAKQEIFQSFDRRFK